MMKKILICLFLAPNLVFGATSDFQVSYIPYDDTTPPTTPTLLSVIPVAYSQIDVAWSASIDDMVLAGYVVLRDGNPIATTSQLTFSDSGLSASTTYSYQVYAFDNFFNISTTSNALATTTLEAPIIPPVIDYNNKSEGKSGGLISPLELISFQTFVEKNKIKFSWTTNRPARFSLRWGETGDSVDGYVENEVFKEKQETVIYNLKPDTEYFFELIGIDTGGREVVLKKDSIKTKAEEKKNLVQNVLRFTAETINETEVFLTWQLPLIPNLQEVRVVKNPYYWPTSPNDGEIIYEGLKTSFLDKVGLKNDDVQYYTIFVITGEGDWSSGAVAVVRKSANNLPIIPDNKSDLKPTESQATTSEDNKKDSDGLITDELAGLKLNFGDIKVVQNGKEYSFLEERILLTYKDPFLLSIKKESLPTHLKIIIATLVDPTNHSYSYSFIVKLNEDKTAYEAVLAPLHTLGISSLQIEVFDLENKTIGHYKKQIDFVVGDTKNTTKEESSFFSDKVFSSIFLPVIFLFCLIVLIFFFLILIKRRREEEENEQEEG